MGYQFSEKVEKKFQWLLERYPSKDAVLLPLLHLVQDEHPKRFLAPDAIDYVASRMELSPARIKEVASFYSLFRLNQKGQYVIQVCHNLSCYLRGAEDILATLKKALNIKEGESTSDGKFTLERVECLASCSTAPMLQVNDWDFHEELTPERALELVENLKQDRFAKASFEDRRLEGSQI